MAGIIHGLVSDGTLPSSAKQDLAGEIGNPSSVVRRALDGAWLGQGDAAYPQRALERQLAQTVKTGTVLDSFKDPTLWSLSFGPGTVTTANREMTITTVSSGTTMARRDVAVDLTGRVLSFEVMRDANLAALEVRVSTGSTGTSKGWHMQENVAKIPPGVWYRVTYPLGQLDVVGGATPAEADDVQAFRIAAVPATGADTVLKIRDMRVHVVATPPAVHFQFDDGFKDTYTTAYPILKAAGYTGGIAVEHNTVGNPNRCTLDELKQMYADGWSMYGHHTVRSTDNTVEVVRQHMLDSQEFLDSNGFVRGGAHWVWPGGARDVERETMALSLWRSVRKVNSHHYYSAPYVYDRADPSHVYIQKNMSLETAKAHVDKALAYGVAVVFVFHGIVEVEDAQESWAVSKFQGLVDYAKEKGLVDTNFDLLFGSFRP